MTRSVLIVCALFLSLFAACDNGSNAPGDADAATDSASDGDAILPDNDEVVDPLAALFGDPALNPSGQAPLTAEIPFTPDIPGALALRIECPALEGADPYEKEFAFTVGATIPIPVMGLYADCSNLVTITVFDGEGSARGTREFTLTTAPAPEDLPTATAVGTYAGDAFTFIVYYLTRASEEEPEENGGVETVPGVIPEFIGIMFDKKGHIRWYSDLTYKKIAAIEIVDGYIYGSDWGTEAGVLWWHDFMGRTGGSLDIGALGFLWIHHDVIKLPNGHLVLTADPITNDYVEEYLIEVDMTAGTVVKEWDLRPVFPDVADLYRDIPPTSTETYGVTNDPIHLNGIAYDPVDGGLVVSSQRSGIAKIAADGTLRWLLAPHLTRYIDDANGDGVSDSFMANYDPDNQMTWIGDFTGENYTDERMPCGGAPAEGTYPFDFSYGEFLLTPLDGAGAPITDEQVLRGFIDGDSFRWPFRPHAPLLKDDGTLLLFDNGLSRGFTIINQDTFSRAVAYRITPDGDGYGGTVEQTAEYLLAHDPMWHRFSAAVSDVDELPDGSLLITSGALGTAFYPPLIMTQYGDGPIGAYIAQVDAETGDEMHSLLVERVISEKYPNAPFSVYRAERVDPYANFALPEGLTAR
ncbi:MAG TPA: aryl-sulfate sulfotransferase [bacterium]|nr:aryl-sulfate sulfotransferase [bacterium]